MVYDDILETAKSCAQICLINMQHEADIHSGYVPFPNGLMTENGEYTKEARLKFNEMLVHFIAVLEESVK
jgi:hypothetical protein